MKKNVFLTAILALVLVFGLAVIGCGDKPGGGGGDTIINIATIAGVTIPVQGATPVTAITANNQYTGTIAWHNPKSTAFTTFAYDTVYTATITLTAKTGYTLQGVTENFFTVTGATSVTNANNSGVITAVFPATAEDPSLLHLSGTITINPNTGVTINTELTATYSGTETVTYQWEKDGSNVGTNSNKYTPTVAGSYSVTVSATGYNSKTSSAVTVTEPTTPTFASIADFADYIASLDNNTLATPYTIALNLDELPVGDWQESSYSNLQKAFIDNSGTYINLDLSGSTFTSIGRYAFGWCHNLASVTIGNSVTSIGEWAFSSCSSLASVTIPNSVTSIGDQAFYYASSLTSVTIPNGITSIGNEAFAGCHSLTSVTIPNSVTSIGSIAFFECISLESVIIPDSVTSIEAEAFSRCYDLVSVTFEGTIAKANFSSNSAFDGDLRAKFYATDSDNGTPGTYTTSRSVDNSSVWTKEP